MTPDKTKARPVPAAPAQRPPLSRAAITATARNIADTEGIGELTLRRVAAELGTGQASLYRHIAHRAELLGLLTEDLAVSFPIVEPAPGDPPTEAIAAQWLAVYDFMAAHHWAAKVIAEGKQLAAGTRPLLEHGLALLRAAGLSEADALRGYRALWHLLLGHLLNEHPFGHGDPDAGGPGGSSPDSTPEPAGAEFEWALRRLIAGMGRMGAWHR
ncbi:MAG TPA: TetR/AcrR family transcriptional regulator C-terminal domain-containing protein [Pseudonocardia sp.]|nr:TetR/AcrR family transcriptional regulator C-terminal domain-containing protein [Pseudonocardia sp.]